MAIFSGKHRKARLQVLAACYSVAFIALCAAEIAAAPLRVTATRYYGFSAYRLSDGRTEAVVVPAINRVMRYGFVGGPNWLWNSPALATKGKKGGWPNWGGDKTWLAPQSQWPLIGGRGWPPDEATDGAPAVASQLPGGILRVVTPISPFSGVRVQRDYSYGKDGSFVIVQTVEKKKGGPLYLSAWSVTQIVPADAIFIPLNAQSPYKNNFLWLGAPQPNAVSHRSETLLQMSSLPGATYKVGSDALVSALGAVKDGVLFSMRAGRPGGDYPDGALGAGLPVEVYNSGFATLYYNELELLSPLRLMYVGTRFTHTVKWRLQDIQKHSDITAETRAWIERELQKQ